MGMRKRAWTLVSRIIGARPKKVVREVSRIGRKRRTAASTIAWQPRRPSRG
jgi:hypothetical protein